MEFFLPSFHLSWVLWTATSPPALAGRAQVHVCMRSPRQLMSRIFLFQVLHGSTGIITCWCVAEFWGFRSQLGEEVWELLRTAARAVGYCVAGSLRRCLEKCPWGGAKGAVNTGCEAHASMRTVGELVNMIVDWLEPLPVDPRRPGSLGSPPCWRWPSASDWEGVFEKVLGAISCVEEFGVGVVL